MPRPQKLQPARDGRVRSLLVARVVPLDVDDRRSVPRVDPGDVQPVALAAESAAGQAIPIGFGRFGVRVEKKPTGDKPSASSA